jgi:hypothetical protein
VSKNALSGIRFFAVEDESGGQWAAQLAQAGERLLAGRITAYFEGALVSDSNLDPVPFFQFERLNYGGG